MSRRSLKRYWQVEPGESYKRLLSNSSECLTVSSASLYEHGISRGANGSRGAASWISVAICTIRRRLPACASELNETAWNESADLRDRKNEGMKYHWCCVPRPDRRAT